MFILAVFFNGVIIGISIYWMIDIHWHKNLLKELDKLKEDQLRLEKIAKELKNNEDPYGLFNKD